MSRWVVIPEPQDFRASDTVRLLREVDGVQVGRKGVVASIEPDHISVFVPERMDEGGNTIRVLQVEARDIELTEQQEPWHELLA